jgi:signal transduction histidine kinase
MLNASLKNIDIKIISQLTMEKQNIYCDKNRFKQIMINFLSNAIKF